MLLRIILLFFPPPFDQRDTVVIGSDDDSHVCDVIMGNDTAGWPAILSKGRI